LISEAFGETGDTDDSAQTSSGGQGKTYLFYLLNS